MESVFITAALVGVTELAKAVKNQDVDRAFKIVAAAVIGGLAGFFAISGLDVTSGIIAGLSAAGIFKVGQVVSGR